MCSTSFLLGWCRNKTSQTWAELYWSLRKEKRKSISQSKRFQRWRVLTTLYYYMVMYTFSILKTRQQPGDQWHICSIKNPQKQLEVKFRLSRTQVSWCTIHSITITTWLLRLNGLYTPVTDLSTMFHDENSCFSFPSTQDWALSTCNHTWTVQYSSFHVGGW